MKVTRCPTTEDSTTTFTVTTKMCSTESFFFIITKSKLKGNKLQHSFFVLLKLVTIVL